MIKANFFEAYLDESGTHAGSPILAVAGYFGTHDQWNGFLDKWRHKDFHACDPSFAKFKEELVNAIDDSEIEGAEVCIRPYEFAHFATADLKSNMGNAYAITAFLCATGICKLVTSENADAKVALILEDGQPNVLHLQRMLISMIPEFPAIASVTVTSKGNLPQMHPADFLAHSRSTTNKQWMDRLFAKGRVREWPVDHDIFVSTSVEVARLLRLNRRNKAKAKLAKRLGG